MLGHAGDMSFIEHMTSLVCPLIYKNYNFLLDSIHVGKATKNVEEMTEEPISRLRDHKMYRNPISCDF